MLPKLIGFLLVSFALCVSANETVVANPSPTISDSDVKQTDKKSCHLKQQRASHYCQSVMFPPIPMR